MVEPSRRDLLRLGATAGALGLFPPAIRRALALPAKGRTGTIEDVEHIVVLMQENRSFDHYFGHLSGVRGYNDRHPVLRADGRPVWRQPRQHDPAAEVLPFRLGTQTSSAECVLDLDHSWYLTQAALAAGRNDRWPAHKSDMTMGYYTRADIPFHYALADAFTICDQYFCSTPSGTHPNRMYLMTGTVDPSGAGGGPLLDNVDYLYHGFLSRVPEPFTWTTYPERLEAAGISWQIYQQGLSITDHYEGNFATNMLANFHAFVAAPEGSPLRRRGLSKRTLADLKQDVLRGQLPQVSWLLPPAAFSEHPRWTPAYGAAYMARILDALTANPGVWSRTALFVTYDENDGYFDHVAPPQPPTPARPGKSTISVAGEVHDYVSPFGRDKFHADNLPYGLGPRVGMIAISPWSKGGYVCSEVFDHTSIIRFIEKRFGVAEPNITPWRRAICGDLTSAFDFAAPRADAVALPDTRDYLRKADATCRLPAPGVPEISTPADVEPQEPGQRPARPLPYDLAVDECPGPADRLSLRLSSHGAGAACFYAYREGSDEMPRRYAVGPGSSLQDDWTLPGAAAALFTIAGPNGFLRRYRRAGRARLLVAARHLPLSDALRVTLGNPGSGTIIASLRDVAYGAPERQVRVPPGASVTTDWPVAASHHWYDLAITISERSQEETRLSGHVETGRESMSDPAATMPVLHNLLPG